MKNITFDYVDILGYTQPFQLVWEVEEQQNEELNLEEACQVAYGLAVFGMQPEVIRVVVFNLEPTPENL